jgi:hypothetical protein
MKIRGHIIIRQEPNIAWHFAPFPAILIDRLFNTYWIAIYWLFFAIHIQWSKK